MEIIFKMLFTLQNLKIKFNNVLNSEWIKIVCVVGRW